MRRSLQYSSQRFSIGRSKFFLLAVATLKDSRIGVQLCLEGPDKQAHFTLIENEKEVIEQELDETLEWRALPEKKSGIIQLMRHDCDPADRERWPEQHQWIFDKLQIFHKTFAERIKHSDPSELANDPT